MSFFVTLFGLDIHLETGNYDNKVIRRPLVREIRGGKLVAWRRARIIISKTK